MTEHTTPLSRWRRVVATSRGRAEVVALALVIVVCGAVALDVIPAIAGEEKLVGRPVPEEDVPALVAAALSCPALTPPKVAAQVMAATAFGANSANQGLAGLDDATWSKWRPSSGASRTDREDSVLAMAHFTCEVVGQLRTATIEGDLWSAALAVDKVGLPAVVTEKGVPEAARPYVDKVNAYANWYADQPQFSFAPTKASASASPEQVVPVPDWLVNDINAAGRICPTVTPARVAAQLRALSGFNASLRSDNGAAGIAQFSDDLWNRYQPGAAASRWDPDDAVPAMGTAMCDMSNQFAGLSGAAPYTLALGAYQWGADVVRQANGLPRANVPQLADQVNLYTPMYEKDPRLTRKSTTPSPSPSVAKPAPSRSTPTPTPTATTATAKPTPPAGVTFDPNARYQIRNAWAGAVLELPGDDLKHPSGTRVQLWNNKHGKDQYWRIKKAATAGYVMILNDFTGQALAVEKASTENMAKLVVAAKDDSARTQQWRLTDGGDGRVSVENLKSGKVMELLGNDLGPPIADGTWNGYWVEQYERKPKVNKDQHWLLVK